MSHNGKEILIFGAGPAGLSSADQLAGRGHNVTLVHPLATTGPRSIYTTYSSEQELIVPLTPGRIRPLPLIRVITQNGTDFRVNTGSQPYYLVNNKVFLSECEERLSQIPNITIEALPKRVLSQALITDSLKGSQVTIDGNKKVYDVVLDCTGVGAEVVSKVDPRRKEEVWLGEYVYGGSFKGTVEKPEMILVIGPAGGTSWVCPNIHPGFVDVVYSAWGPYKDFKPRFLPTAKDRLSRLLDFIQNFPGIEIESRLPDDIYAGVIRSQPASAPLVNSVFCLGESAGMAKPGSGDSWRYAFKAGRMVAELIDKGGDARKFHEIWTTSWNHGFFYAGVLARMPYQRKGELGGTFDCFGKWLEDADPNLVKQIEEWLIGNKPPLSLLIRTLIEPRTRRSLLEAVKKKLEISFLGVPAKDLEWSLPEVS
ncbi:hypothetical protein HYW44_00660 [Candidatus Daviesbacteria bacterium]|nr:hypothetical protein [Candidatus Daviesbacteria bacterium]